MFLLRTGANDDQIAAVIPQDDIFAPRPHLVDVTGSDFASFGLPDLDEWLTTSDAGSVDVSGRGARRPDAAAARPHLEYAQRTLPGTREAVAPGVFGPIGWTAPITQVLHGYFDDLRGHEREPAPGLDQVALPEVRYFTAPLEIARQVAAVLKVHMDDYELVIEGERPGAGEYMAIAEMSGQAATLHGLVVSSARTDERAEFREIHIPSQASLPLSWSQSEPVPAGVGREQAPSGEEEDTSSFTSRNADRAGTGPPNEHGAAGCRVCASPDSGNQRQGARPADRPVAPPRRPRWVNRPAS
jgi:hypothetical protein